MGSNTVVQFNSEFLKGGNGIEVNHIKTPAPEHNYTHISNDLRTTHDHKQTGASNRQLGYDEE